MDEKLIKEIKERATIFAIDNLRNLSKLDVLMIESAMLIGASIAIELQTKEEIKEKRRVLRLLP